MLFKKKVKPMHKEAESFSLRECESFSVNNV